MPVSDKAFCMDHVICDTAYEENSSRSAEQTVEF
jgi:hypothetical protein